MGCAGLLSLGVHVVCGALVATMVMRVSTVMPPMRVFLLAPAGSAGPSAKQDAAPSVAPTAEAVGPQQPAVKRAQPMARQRPRIARHTPRSVDVATAPPVPALPADTTDRTGAAASPYTLAGAGGGGHGDVAGSGNSPGQPSDDPVLISKVVPQYPPIARLRGIEGQVVLQAIVASDGRIEPEISVVQSIPLLDSAAIAALRQWRFRPAHDRAGTPIRVSLRVPVRFVLH